MPTSIGLDGNLSTNTNAYDNPAFSDAIKDMDPHIYRTPGAMADGDGRIPQGFHWRTDYPKLEGVKAMWDKSHPKMIFVLNMVDKGLRNNLSMLQYAASIGLPVDYIEYGNEFNIFGSVGRQIYTTVDDYAKTCADWIKTISQDFPGAQSLLVGENKHYQDTVHWNASCLQYNPDAMLVWHYHTPAQYVFNGVPDINIIQQCIDEEKENAFPDVPIKKIAITEFSTEQQNHDLREMVNFIDDAAEELAVTTMLQKFTEIGLPIACYHNVIGAAGKGAIMTSRFGTWLEPAGKAIKAFIQ